MRKKDDEESRPTSEKSETVSSSHEVGPIERHDEVTIIRQPSDPVELARRTRDNPVDPVGPVDFEHREHFFRNAAAERALRLHKATQAIWWAVTIVEGIIALRVLLRLIGANPDNPFARFVYNLSSLFLWPFLSLVPSPSSDGLVLEVSSIIGMLVIAGLTWALVRLIWILFEHTEVRTSSTVDRFRK